jgi:iron complex outermembrane receptor protein
MTQYELSEPYDRNNYLYPSTDPRSNASAEKQQTRGLNLQVDYDLGFATLTGQVGNRHVSQRNSDLGGGGVNTAPTPLGVPSRPLTIQSIPAESDTWSGEVRLTSASDEPLEWVGGLFYFNERNSGALCPLLAPGVCLLDVASPEGKTESYAAFGQTTWTPIDKLHLTLGLRYNNDHKEGVSSLTARSFFAPPFPINLQIVNGVQTIAPSVNPALPGVPTGNTPPSKLEDTWEKVTGSFGVAYDFTDDNMAYVRVATGYSAGGIAYGSQPVYEPETIRSYELGTKNRFLDGRLQVNMDAWRYEYKGTTQNVIVPSPTAPSPPFNDLTVANIGELLYMGVSSEIIFALTERDRIDAFLQAMPTARYEDFVVPAQFGLIPKLDLRGVPLPENPNDFTGDRVPATPRWSGRLGYTHSFSLFGGNLDAHLDVQFADKTHMTTLASADTLQDYERPTYGSGDVRLTYSPQSERWNVTAFCNNVTDERVVSSPTTYNANTGFISGNYMPPRIYGLIARVNFGAE